jgi:hypothetical protein
MDETVRGERGGNDETHATPTQASETNVAWSDESYIDDAGRRPLPRSLKVLLSVVAVGAIGVVAFLAGIHQKSQTAAPSITPTTGRTTGAAALPPATTFFSVPPVSPDDAYLAELKAQGWQIVATEDMIRTGQEACVLLRGPTHPSNDQAARELMTSHVEADGSSVDFRAASTIALAAQHAYCPETKQSGQ